MGRETGSADDSGTLESEEAHGTADRAPHCRGHAAGGWASAAADCLSRQRLRRSSRLTSRNLGEPVNNRPFTLLLGSTSCGNRPVRRATTVRPIESITYDARPVVVGQALLPQSFTVTLAALDDVRNGLVPITFTGALGELAFDPLLVRTSQPHAAMTGHWTT